MTSSDEDEHKLMWAAVPTVIAIVIMFVSNLIDDSIDKIKQQSFDEGKKAAYTEVMQELDLPMQKGVSNGTVQVSAEASR
jgi:hypothetical protein